MTSVHLSERVRKFFKKAGNSLRAAREVNLSADDPPTDRVCFDCQMCAEFALKTFLLANKLEYRKYSHNLSEALDACISIDSSFSTLETACKSLDGYRGATEYSIDDYAFPSVETTKEVLEKALHVQEFIELKLNNLGFLGD